MATRLAKLFSPQRIGSRLTADIVDRNLDRIRQSIADIAREYREHYAFGLANYPRTVANYAAARKVAGFAGLSILVAGRTTARDGGEGTFVWRTGAATDNDGTILAGPTGSGGYWERVTDGVFNPLWWGADPTNTSDSASAFNFACSAAQSYLQTEALTVVSGTLPTVRIPNGKYRLDSSVAVGAYVRVESSNAQLIATGAFSVLKDVYYTTEIVGLRIFNGTRGIEIFEGLQPGTITIKDCSFHEQTQGAIWGADLSNAALITIEGCKFYSVTGTGRKLIYLPTGDVIVIRRNDIYSANGIFLGQSPTGRDSANRVIYENNLFTPASGLDCFIDNDSLNLQVVANRFGGEAGATTIVKHRSGILQSSEATSLVIERNALQSASEPSVVFYDVPGTFKFKCNQGSIERFSFDSGCFSVPGYARSRLMSWEVSDNQIDDVRYEGAAEDVVRCLSADRRPNEVFQSNVDAASYVMKIDVDETSSYGFSGITTSIAVTTGLTNSFGSPAESYTGTGASYSGSLGRTWVNALNGLTSGQYTAVFDAEVTSESPVTVLFNAGGSDHNITLRKGKHSVCIPFWFDSGGTATPGATSIGCEALGWTLFPMANTQVLKMSTVRVFKGTIRTHPQYSEVLSVAPPSSGTWRAGDVARAPMGAGWRYQDSGWSPAGATVFAARSVNLLATGQTELIPAMADVRAITLSLHVRVRSRTGAVTTNATIRAGNSGSYDNVAASWLMATSTVNETESLATLSGAVDVGSTEVSFSVESAASGPSEYTADIFWHGILI